MCRGTAIDSPIVPNIFMRDKVLAFKHLPHGTSCGVALPLHLSGSHEGHRNKREQERTGDEEGQRGQGRSWICVDGSRQAA